MRKLISLLFILLSLAIFFDVTNAGYALLLFVTVGVIPGTNEALSPTASLQIFSLLAGFFISRLTISFVDTAQRAQYFQPKAAALVK